MCVEQERRREERKGLRVVHAGVFEMYTHLRFLPAADVAGPEDKGNAGGI